MMRVSKRTASGTSVRRVLSRSAKRFIVPFDRLEDRTVLSNVMNPVGTIADEILVQYRPEANVQTRAANRANAGFGLLDEIDSAQRLNMGQGMIELVKVPAGMTTEAAVSWLTAQPGVEFAEPNQILTLSAVSNDPYYTSGSLWGMYGSDSPASNGPAGTTNANGIHAENAWNAGYTGSRSVYVGIIDTGVQIAHPELASNVWVNPYDPVDGIDNDGNGYVDDTNGWDFAANDRTVYDSTSDSHGTHVAGTIGGAGGNGIGVAGVNWQVSMIVAKFIAGNSGTTTNAIRAIDYITDLKLRHGLNIAATNNSWGGGSYSSAMNAAIIRAAKAEILFVAAAGNNSANIDSTAFYPAAYSTLVSVGTTSAANYEGVISVASITSTGGLSSFSNYGATRVDIGAPGSSIMSTLPVNTYGSYNGTSMATPHVTGSIALLKSIYTSATAAQLRNAILASATPTASLAGKVVSGGRLNVFSAINLASWNPAPQIPNVTVADVSKNEGNSGTSNLVFTVSLSVASAQPVTIAYTTQNGTALAGADYTSSSGTLTIPAGATSGNIAVAITGDTVYESSETFRLILSSATNGTITDGEATGTILNDDAKPAISIGNPRLLEGNSGSANMVFSVSITNPADTPVTFQYATSDLTATSGIDYVSTSGMITIAAGATSATIAVPILGDTEYEADETFRVTLSNPSSNATISAPFATGSIINDDTPPVPSISIVSPSKSEGNSGSSSIGFTVSLSGASASPVTVNYVTSSGSASAGSDYVATSGTLTIPAGSTSGTIAVTIFGDNIYEADETFVVTLSSPVNATLANATATGTILNDDAKPAISIANASLIEGNAGSASMIFTVTLANPADAPVSFQYATSDLTATAGADYQATSGTISIPAGETSATIAVPIIGDTVFEADETFRITLSNPSSNATIANAIATGTILNDDTPPVPSISIASASKTEGNSGTSTLVFNVSMTATAAVPVTVSFVTSSGTATAGSDFAAIAGTLTIPAGLLSTSISVTIFGDNIYEADETFVVTLSSPVNATLANATATGTILNDDAKPAISIANASLIEGNAGSASMIFTLTLANPADAPVSFQYATSDLTATAGADYQATSGTISIPAGETSATIAVPIIGDTAYEADETFRITLSNPSSNATIANAIATGTILNDDAVIIPAISIAGVSKSEGNSGSSSAVFTVSLSSASASPVTVNYATSSGTASSGSDYAATSGTLTIPAGATSGTIAVTIFGDNVYEADETFVVTLSSPVNATLANATATGTILNDDAKPAIAISQSSLIEGDSGTSSMVFTVTLTNPASTPVSVDYSTSDGTALAGSDYLATGGTLTIPAGATSATIAVPILGDTEIESNETFALTLSSPSTNATIGTATATGTILNDDQSAIEMSVADVEYIEGSSGWSQMSFVVSLSAPATKDITVMFTTSDGTASSRGNTSDYEATGGILTIPSGKSTGLISVRVKGDKTFELDETFFLNLSKPSDGIVLTRNQAVGTIVNDDTATGPRGGNIGSGFNESSLGDSSEIIASPVPELDFVLGEWMSRSKKISRAN